jgi:type II secretory pathway pseudopilin PulG
LKTTINQRQQAGSSPAFTIIELLIATGITSILAMMVVYLTIFGARSFQAMANYSDMDSQSRNAVDLISKSLRQGSSLLSYTTTSPKSLILTNSTDNTFMKLTWAADTRLLTYQATGYGSRTLLSQCDSWDFALFSRAPMISSTNVTFYPATNGAGMIDVTRCKLVNMTWKCSRTILGSKLNTETVQTAQIILRNKTK